MENRTEQRKEERLPQIVEDRLQETYEKIREGKGMRKKRPLFRYRRWTGVAAACAVLAVGSAGVMAASYFQKEFHQEGSEASYEFSVNYELTPGEYKVTPSYLPEGFQDQGAGKYYGEDGLGITIMPTIYTTAELDKLDGKIALSGKIDKVEHMTLSGMEADLITYQEAQKYQKNTEIYLFNPAEGCVIQIVSCYTVDREELLKFADSLTVERVGDAAFETEEERQAREQENTQMEEAYQEGRKTAEQLRQAGIPKEKLQGVGQELRSFDGGEGYTLLDYEFLDSIEGFEEEKFFEFSRFDGWLKEDKTLKPYTRQHYDADGNLLGEEKTEQQFLRVDLKVHRYENSTWDEVPLDLTLTYVDHRADGSLTWQADSYEPVPEENYTLQMDHTAVYLDQAVHTAKEDRHAYFFRPMETGEDLTYTLLFVVDRDRTEDFVLAPAGSNSSIWQADSMSAEEIREALDGYIRLQ